MIVPDYNADVVVVGAGPGGLAAAIELARGGREVLVVEKSVFPREKVCGGCLSGDGVRRLRHLLADDHTRVGVDSHRVTFAIGNYRLTHLPQPGAARMAPRAQLDAALAAAAQAAGAEIRFGQPARIKQTLAGWQVEVAGDCIRPRHLLLASGLGHLQGKLPFDGRHRSRRLISQQWVMPVSGSLPERGAVELHWMRGGYVGLATPEHDRCVVALAARAPSKGNLSALELLYRLNPREPLWRSIPPDSPGRYASKGCGGFPWRPPRLGDGNLLLVGDAAGYEEPYSGEGIGQAMHSGCCAAAAILAANSAATSTSADVLARYTAQMQMHHRWICRRTRLMSYLLNTHFMQTVVALPPVLPTPLLTKVVGWMHVK